MTALRAVAERRQVRALWLAVFVILTWGAGASIQKSIFAEITPGAYLFIRYLILPVMAVFALWAKHRAQWPNVPREDRLKFLKLGLTGHFFHVGLLSIGLELSTPFSSVLILASGSVFTLLLLRWKGIEVLSRGQILGVSIAFIGIITFMSDKLFRANWAASAGDLVLLASTAAFAYYTVAAKQMFARYDSLTVVSYVVLCGSLPVVLFALPWGLATDWLHLSVVVWIKVIWATLISSFVCLMLWGWINNVRGVARTAPLLYAMPVIAALLAWLANGERYTTVKLLGATVTLVGVVIAQQNPEPATSQAI